MENPWASPHFAPAIMAQQFPMGQQPSPTAFTTLVPVTAPGSILAEQMKSLNLSGEPCYDPCINYSKRTMMPIRLKFAGVKI